MRTFSSKLLLLSLCFIAILFSGCTPGCSKNIGGIWSASGGGPQAVVHNGLPYAVGVGIDEQVYLVDKDGYTWPDYSSTFEATRFVRAVSAGNKLLEATYSDDWDAENTCIYVKPSGNNNAATTIKCDTDNSNFLDLLIAGAPNSNIAYVVTEESVDNDEDSHLSLFSYNTDTGAKALINSRSSVGAGKELWGLVGSVIQGDGTLVTAMQLVSDDDDSFYATAGFWIKSGSKLDFVTVDFGDLWIEQIIPNPNYPDNFTALLFSSDDGHYRWYNLKPTFNSQGVGSVTGTAAAVIHGSYDAKELYMTSTSKGLYFVANGIGGNTGNLFAQRPGQTNWTAITEQGEYANTLGRMVTPISVGGPNKCYIMTGVVVADGSGLVTTLECL